MLPLFAFPAQRAHIPHGDIFASIYSVINLLVYFCCVLVVTENHR